MRYKLDPLSASGISVVSQFTTISAGSSTTSSGASVSDDAYGAGWDGDTTNAPSKNALYDKIETMGGAGSGDVVGPASSVDNAIVRYDSTTGKLLQGYTSGDPTIGDTGDVVFQGAAVFNEAGADKDFRVEGDTNTNMIFVDASADFVGIGNGTPGTRLNVGTGFTLAAANTSAIVNQYSNGAGPIGMYLVNTVASDATAGSGMVMASNDGALMANGHRLGFFLFAGGDGTTIQNRAGFTSFAMEDWSGSAQGTEIRVETTPIGSTTRSNGVIFTTAGGMTINEQGRDADTRIEGDTDANLIFADASTDRVGIGTATPGFKFSVNGANGQLSLSADTDGGAFNLNATASGSLAIYGTAGNILDVDLLDGALKTNGTTRLTNAGILQNTNTLLTAAPSADHSVSGTTIQLVANENQAIGDVCYINATGEAQLADADAIATSVVQVMCADATIAADATGNYLVMGVARDDTWAWTVGGLIYLSTTGTSGNTLTQTAPSGTDDCVVVVGVATHADRMLFRPSQQGIVEVV